MNAIAERNLEGLEIRVEEKKKENKDERLLLNRDKLVEEYMISHIK